MNNKSKQHLCFKLSVILLLFSISVKAQIPEGYYSTANGLTAEQLKSALHKIIKDHKEFPYTSSSTDTWDILKETDKDTVNPDNVILFYSGWSVNAAQEYNNNTGWSREHVWAKSHGDFGTTMGAGTDCHHLRPADITVNSARNNKDFDIGGEIYVDGDGITECRSDNDSWEARDEVKGDVARMLFYMAVRYEGDNGEPDLELVDEVNTYDLNESGKGYHGKLSTLIQWHLQDPVDSFEINRNNVIYTYQENRNPFIDHPEYVDLIWGTETGTGDLLNSDGIRIYPNPASDNINFKLNDGGTGRLSMYAISGKEVLNKKIVGDYVLSTQNLNSGLYFIRYIDSSGEVYTRKQLVSK